MNSKNSIAKILVATTLALVQPVFAGYSCTVKITAVYVYVDGAVMATHTGRNDLTQVCNLNVEWKGVSTSTCAIWTGMMSSIKRSAGNATFYYDGTAACSTLPTYGNAPAPVYIAATQ